MTRSIHVQLPDMAYVTVFTQNKLILDGSLITMSFSAKSCISFSPHECLLHVLGGLNWVEN